MIYDSAEVLFTDSLSVLLCWSKQDAVQNMQFCSLAESCLAMSANHFFSNTSRLSKQMLCNSFGWLPLKDLKFDFHEVKPWSNYDSNIHYYYNALIFFLSDNFRFARADPLIHTSPDYQACCCPRWLSLTLNLCVFCCAQPIRAECLAFDFELVLIMNFDTWSWSWFRKPFGISARN